MKTRIAVACMALAVGATLSAREAQAQQEGFLGEIRYFAGNFAPRSWAYCDGQLLPISQYSALFSILGTTYGGDGVTTFALPDMRGRVPIHPGTGTGLTRRSLGERFGSEINIMSVNQMPAHSHTGKVRANSGTGSGTTAAGAVLATSTVGIYAGRAAPDTDMAAGTVQTDNTGGGQQQNNMQPSLGVHCIIATQGIFPSRN